VLNALALDADNESSMADSTCVRAHQHAAGGKRGAQSQCIGRSRGGATTKIHALVDGLGNPTHIHLTPGNIHDIVEAPALIEARVATTSLPTKATTPTPSSRRSEPRE